MTKKIKNWKRIFSTGFDDKENRVTPELAKRIENAHPGIVVSRTGRFVWFLAEDRELLEALRERWPDIAVFVIQEHFLD